MQAELELLHRWPEDSDDRLDWRAAVFRAGQLRYHHGCFFIQTKLGGNLSFDLVGSLGIAGTARRKYVHVRLFVRLFK
jgi:hypothetical protein